jgi:hypothetical protein
MGLFDGYYDPDHFEASGGLLGRLLSLQRQEGFLPHPDFDLPPSGNQPPRSSLMPWVASGSLSPAQALQPHYEALGAAMAGGNATPDATRVHPGPLVLPLANREQSESNPARAQPNAIQNALTDFYRQTILQAGRDIAGYTSDAVRDPAAFARGIAPSLVGLGPLVGELPAAIRGLAGTARSVGASPMLEDVSDSPASPAAPVSDQPEPLPDNYLGNNIRFGGNRGNSDLPGSGPTPEELFDKLTGGRSITHPDGTREGSNGVRLRPGGGNGPRIDIPANGNKKHETIHFPGFKP